MECHSIIKNLKINKNKNFHKIIFVVEGEKEEILILKQIFYKILDYNYIVMRKKVEEYKSKSKKKSTVIVMNTSDSNIKSILKDKNYKEKIYEFIHERYQEDLTNIPIYFIWDRDCLSNSKSAVEHLLNTFSNSLDNDNYEMNGLLLLSFPCVECYEYSLFSKDFWKKEYKTSDEIKKAWKKSRFNIQKMNESMLLLAISNMHRILNEFQIYSYDPTDLKKTNLKIFRKEEENYRNFKTFKALSLISVALVDLGIIESVKKQ